jgi:hypothetical protein
MVVAFAHALQQSLAGLRLDAGIVRDIQSNAARLGGLDTPSNQDPETTAMIQAAIAQAFVFGFRMIMLLCAALALASASVASRTIPFRGAERVSDLGRVVAAK